MPCWARKSEPVHMERSVRSLSGSFCWSSANLRVERFSRAPLAGPRDHFHIRGNQLEWLRVVLEDTWCTATGNDQDVKLLESLVGFLVVDMGPEGAALGGDRVLFCGCEGAFECLGVYSIVVF